ncbi:hypothetical protein EV646_101716 [Kribbella antiqua]|uniref:Transcriptional regulator, AbiEi antitoxin, Type IV TA system n=1 Tax=Kribbella antiqua TaxID=2512217 RepID=A0A4R2J2U5_9ACTN|nr:hypothetical protein [Kribbella antiqua]TCO51722.1 hypothetical protein EV646_101716 [Kribbella antiqua]
MDRLAYDVRGRLHSAVQTPQRRQVLLALGLDDADLRRLLRKRQLQHHHGHYLDGHIAEELARIACAQAAYPGSVVSHFSAAQLTGLRTWSDSKRPSTPPVDAVWLTRRPDAKRNQRRQDIVVRRAGLAAADLSRHQWLPLTSPARTVVDLARALPLREAIVTVDHALRTGMSLAELEAVLLRQHRWTGIRRARIAIDFGDPRSESALESIARTIFADAGLPAPVLQAQFWDGARWMLERVDFWWPQFRTVAEADGLAKYDADSPEERRLLIRRSHRRDQRLSDRAVELVHFGWEDALDPRSDLPARLREAFHRGTSRPGDGPTWRAPDPHAPALWLPAA